MGSRNHGRGDVDDATETPFDHAVEHVPDEQQWCEHVRVDGGNPLVAAPLSEPSGRWSAVVGDEDVGRGAHGQERGARRGLGDVAHDRLHVDG